MNYASRNLRAVPAISLAEEPDFLIGPLKVRPSARQISIDERTETVEPRVMQVLVVLARADGAVVSREQLTDQCWGGRIVGDDAITNAIVKVRALAGLSDEPAFEIETVPRVGYRLRERHGNSARESPTPPPPPAHPISKTTWPLVAAIGALVIAIGLIAVLSYYLRPEPKWAVVESHLPYISTPAIERYPALSPDGIMIAYSAGPSVHNRHIFLRLLKGGDPIQLTHDNYDASAPAWSPDSKMIAYVIAQTGHPCRVMEIPIPVGEPHQIGQCQVSERSSLAFHPSGRSLFFSDSPARGAGERIYKLDLENGRVSVATHAQNAAFADSAPVVAPNGNAVLYSRDLGLLGTQVRLLSLSNRIDRLVAGFSSGDAAATFSADGSAIFVSRSFDNDNALWAYPVHGGEPWRILSSGEYLGRLSASPNGLLAVEMEYNGGQLVAVTPHSDRSPRPIESGGLKTWCVDYAPDGTFLATGWRSESFGVWISDTQGSVRELFSLPDRLACAIRWSPDGRRFAYLEWRANRYEVPVMTRSGQPIARLSYAAKDSGRIDWTADGKSILTSRQDKSGWRIWRTDVAAPDKSVPISGLGWRDPRVHGAMLFAEKDGVGGIWRVDGTPHRVTDGPPPEAVDVYTIVGDELIYADTSDPDHPTFSAQNISGGHKDRLAPLPGVYVNFVFGVDPKSGDIVYTQRADDTDIGLLRLVNR